MLISEVGSQIDLAGFTRVAKIEKFQVIITHQILPQLKIENTIDGNLVGFAIGKEGMYQLEMIRPQSNVLTKSEIQC